MSAVVKSSKTYEHITPELVGNRQRVLVSDLSGRSNILYKAEEYGLNIKTSDPAVRKVLDELKGSSTRVFSTKVQKPHSSY